ncbi:MAG TPA: AAA family ATPase [Candidatus Dormibacteraeota bacterium]|jgi:ATP-dependent Clp protease ATP-binding subunit ClpB|nr:AAA family ATPase [Candidatus Dormibacteraeota bacterium]
MSTTKLSLDPERRSTQTMEFQASLSSKIVGQEEGVQALVDLYQVFCAGLNSPGRPVGNLLFLGPTGSGKTRIVEAAAEILFGDPRAVIKVDCAEFQHSHEIAKLIGSPPGYLGHRETHPLITQEALAANHTDKLKLSFLLFDEIEKASDALWQLLLGMLDKATLTLGDNRRVDLSQTVIFLTSNLGGGEITELMSGGMGFIQPKDKPTADLDEKVERTAVEAARRKFSPEFMNRLDKVVVFHPLQRTQLEEVLEIELGQVQQRVLETARGQFLFRVTNAARDFLLQEGTDQRYGARHLKRAIERHIVYPLANLLATEQVRLGDLIKIDWDGEHRQLTFVRESEGALVENPLPPATKTAAAAEAQDGRSVDAPTEAVAEERKTRAATPATGPGPAPSSRKKPER